MKLLALLPCSHMVQSCRLRGERGTVLTHTHSEKAPLLTVFAPPPTGGPDHSLRGLLHPAVAESSRIQWETMASG